MTRPSRYVQRSGRLLDLVGLALGAKVHADLGEFEAAAADLTALSVASRSLRAEMGRLERARRQRVARHDEAGLS